MHPGSRDLWGCTAHPAILPPSPRSCQNDGLSVLFPVVETELSRVGGNDSPVVLVKNSLVKNEAWECVLLWYNSQFFVAKVQEEFRRLSRSHRKRHSSARNWLLDLPGRILYEHSLWSQVKRWTCSWHFSSSVSPSSVSMISEFSRTVLTFFPGSLSNYFHGLRRTFPEICTKFDAHSLFLCRIHRDIASGQIHDSI
jgi:hypothetical protein